MDSQLNDFVLRPRFSVDVPALADYFGLWLVYEPPFRSMVERCNGLNLHAHITSVEAMQAIQQQTDRDYSVTNDGIAVIPINGMMMKRASSLSGGTSMIRVRQQLGAAQRDPMVRGAMLLMDTPGGTVSGNQDLCDAVTAFAAVKPVYAFTEDMTASGGVSVASQATKRFANNATALYGCMGTYGVIVDQSGMADKLGVKVHVVKAGDFKGMGTAGTEITEQQLAEMQRIINSLNEGYIGSIAKGLGKPVEAIRSLADGRIHTASDAAGMGLIDGVQSYEQTYGQLVAAASSKAGPKNQPSQQEITPIMAESTTTPEKVPATLAQLKATFPKSSAEWRESQLEAGSTLPASAIAYATFVETRAEAEKAEHAKQLDAARAEGEARAKQAGGSFGHNPLRLRNGRPTTAPASEDERNERQESGDAIEDFNAAVAKAAGPNPGLQKRQRAIRAVATKNPELYEAYLLATNPGKRQSRLISEKLEMFAEQG